MTPSVIARRPRPGHRQRGFTMMEVLVALVVFAISVVGLVAMESRSVESQKAAAEIREAERIAQQWMSELQAASFERLVSEDFEADLNPSFPYADDAGTAAVRVVDFRRPPADTDETERVSGSIQNKFLVVRQVDLIYDPAAPPSDPPALPADFALIQGVALDVTVMWIDDTNPAFPPPATLPGGAAAIAANLDTTLIDATNSNFSPYVGHVTLRTIRLNDVPQAVP